MAEDKKEIYKRAYTELNEIITLALSFELENIPKKVMDNLREQMDLGHIWKYDYDKNIMDQEMMPETKALLIELYARYLCSDEDRQEWEKVNYIYTEILEDGDIEEFDPRNIFYDSEHIFEIKKETTQNDEASKDITKSEKNHSDENIEEENSNKKGTPKGRKKKISRKKNPIRKLLKNIFKRK